MAAKFWELSEQGAMLLWAIVLEVMLKQAVSHTSNIIDCHPQITEWP